MATKAESESTNTAAKTPRGRNLLPEHKPRESKPKEDRETERERGRVRLLLFLLFLCAARVGL